MACGGEGVGEVEGLRRRRGYGGSGGLEGGEGMGEVRPVNMPLGATVHVAQRRNRAVHGNVLQCMVTCCTARLRATLN